MLNFIWLPGKKRWGPQANADWLVNTKQNCHYKVVSVAVTIQKQSVEYRLLVGACYILFGKRRQGPQKNTDQLKLSQESWPSKGQCVALPFLKISPSNFKFPAHDEVVLPANRAAIDLLTLCYEVNACCCVLMWPWLCRSVTIAITRLCVGLPIGRLQWPII